MHPIADHPHDHRSIRLALLALAAGLIGCAAGDDPAAREARPPIEAVEQRVCTGQPLPLTHIDEIVPGPDGRLALVGRRTARVDDAAGIETVAWVVAVLDPRAPDAIELIERTDPADRPTPIAWGEDGLWITRDRARLVPMHAPDAPGIEPPFGVPPVFDADTPHLTIGERRFMVLGERSPRGDVLRHFVEVEPGDPAAGTVDRVVATFGTLRGEHFSFGFEEERVGRFVEAVGITDWHISPDGTLIAMGWVQSFVAPLDFWYRGVRTPVLSDPEAGWFDADALELERPDSRVFIDDAFERTTYDVRAGEDGQARLVSYRSVGSAISGFNGIASPIISTFHDTPPPFADRVKVTTVDAIGGDRLLAGSACVDPPYDDTTVEQSRCRAFVSRFRGESAEARWTVTVDVDDVDHVLDVRHVDGKLLVLAAAYDRPEGRGSSVGPARLLMLDRSGHCTGP